MSDTPPILSREEWEALGTRGIRRPVTSTDVHRQLAIQTDAWGGERIVMLSELGAFHDGIAIGGDALATVMAVAHDLLPAGHPHKITQDDLVALEQAIAHARYHLGGRDATSPAVERGESLAAKLAALLRGMTHDG